MLASVVSLTIVTLADRPDLAKAVEEMETGWPSFMLNDPMGWNLATASHLFPAYQLAALDGDRVVAKGHSAPIRWSGQADDLPDQGWDDVLGRAVRAANGGRPPTAVSALEITIDPARRGQGISRLMVSAMRDNARRLGYLDLVAPVRPSAKHEQGREPMSVYVERRRDDGLPVDPWLRVHARLGGVIVKVCPASMSISGSLEQWRAWTGLSFDHSGRWRFPARWHRYTCPSSTTTPCTSKQMYGCITGSTSDEGGPVSAQRPPGGPAAAALWVRPIGHLTIADYPHIHWTNERCSMVLVSAEN
jgi:GNAT superfamily N-acetyltransferase